MAHWAAIERVSLTLRNILQHRADHELPGAGVEVRVVTPASFQHLGTIETPIVTLFLYQISANAEMRNQAFLRHSDGRESRQPVALELGYLITAWAGRHANTSFSVSNDEAAAREELRLLGIVLQTLSDRAELTASQLSEEDPEHPVFPPEDSVQVFLDSLPIEDHYRIWDASQLSYRLSLTYRVRVVRIDSDVISDPARVAEANMG